MFSTFQSVIFYISFRYFKNQSRDFFQNLIFWISIIGLSLSTSSIIIVLSIMNGFEKNLKDELRLIPQAIITSREEKINIENFPMSSLKNLKNIKRISAIVTKDIILQSEKNMTAGIMLGVSPEEDEPILKYVNQTEKRIFFSEKQGAILGSELARILSIKKGEIFKIIFPDTVQISSNKSIATEKLFTMVGTFHTNQEIDDYQILIGKEDAIKILSYPEKNCTGWRIWMKDPMMVETIKENIPKNMIVHSWKEQKEDLFHYLRIEKNIAIILLILLILSSGFNVIAFSNLFMIRKKKDIFILKIHGLSRRKTMIIFILQGIMISIIGTFIGIMLGILISEHLNFLIHKIFDIFNYSNVSISINYYQIIAVFFSVVFFISLLSAYPCWIIFKNFSIEVYRYDR